MNQMMKKVLSLTMAAVLVLALAACGASGLDMESLGATKWGIESIDGTPYEEFCEQFGLDPETSNSIWEIHEDHVTINGGGSVGDFQIDVKSNGFEVLEGDTIYMSVAYDEGADTLSYKLSNGERTFNYVLCRYE